MSAKIFGNQFDYMGLPPNIANTIVHDEKYIRSGTGKTMIRKIYCDVVYDQFEQKALQDLKALMQKNNVNVSFPDDILYRFLHSYKFDTTKILESLRNHDAWLNSEETFRQSPKMLNILSQGIVYILSRDRKGRPAIVINAYKLDPKQFDINDFLAAMNTVLIVAQQYMFYPGKVENWHILIETNEVGISDLPRGPLQKIIEVASHHFPGCLERIWIINPSMMLKLGWGVIKAFIDERSSQKIQFASKGDFKKLFGEYFDPEQLIPAYNGTMPVPTQYWPPTSPYAAQMLQMNSYNQYSAPQQQQYGQYGQANESRLSRMSNYVSKYQFDNNQDPNQSYRQQQQDYSQYQQQDNYQNQFYQQQAQQTNNDQNHYSQTYQPQQAYEGYKSSYQGATELSRAQKSNYVQQNYSPDLVSNRQSAMQQSRMSRKSQKSQVQWNKKDDFGATSTYQPQQSAYLPQQSAYQPQQSTYQPQQSTYQPQQSTYQPQQSAFQAPQQQSSLPYQSQYKSYQPAYDQMSVRSAAKNTSYQNGRTSNYQYQSSNQGNTQAQDNYQSSQKPFVYQSEFKNNYDFSPPPKKQERVEDIKRPITPPPVRSQTGPVSQAQVQIYDDKSPERRNSNNDLTQSQRMNQSRSQRVARDAHYRACMIQ